MAKSHVDCFNGHDDILPCSVCSFRVERSPQRQIRALTVIDVVAKGKKLHFGNI